ncbi:hypothetical protein HXA34_20335 [Salipaludibacillus agaradhaerens]|nr:hypothetical protein [Salipaludibacillus agaradhaerens]MCR6120670.1 hypothetical protein [Salipaludibacillus agaradhaerens]
MLFEIRDEKGEVYNRVENPAAVFDAESGTLHKIGEADKMQRAFNAMTETYREAGLHGMADDLHYMELPKDQEEIDKVFQNADYIKRLYEKATSL